MSDESQDKTPQWRARLEARMGMKFVVPWPESNVSRNNWCYDRFPNPDLIYSQIYSNIRCSLATSHVALRG
jgi:hypothetical protein